MSIRLDLLCGDHRIYVCTYSEGGIQGSWWQFVGEKSSCGAIFGDDAFPHPQRVNLAHALLLSPPFKLSCCCCCFCSPSCADKVGRKPTVSGESKTSSSSSKRGLTKTTTGNFPWVKVGRQRRHCQQQRMTLSCHTHPLLLVDGKGMISLCFTRACFQASPWEQRRKPAASGLRCRLLSSL